MTVIDDSGWSETVKEWLVDTGYCCAGGLASIEDGIVYAASYGENSGDDTSFNYLYKDDHEETSINEEGKSVKVMINEPTTILDAINKGKAPDGVWIGGEKYKCIMKETDLPSGDYSFDCVALARNKGGATIVKTSAGTVIIAIYDEDLEQQKGNCRATALAFAEHLESMGY